MNLSEAADGTPDRPVILRFAVKEDPDDSNDQAVFYKDNSDPNMISPLPQSAGTLGQALIHVDKYDTEDDDPGDYKNDLEATQQDFLRAGAQVGTVDVTAGSRTITGTLTLFTKVYEGDVIHVLGANNKPAIIEEIVSDTEILVHHGNWATDPGASFEIRRGKHFTAARGTWTIDEGQVSK